jgi:hypothetical protein
VKGVNEIKVRTFLTELLLISNDNYTNCKILIRVIIIILLIITCGSVVVMALCIKAEGLRFETR